MSVATGLAAVTAATCLAAPAQAAGNVNILFNCTDPSKSFQANVNLYGSGAPTAKYEVYIRLTDKIDDTRAPKLRLISANNDGSRTIYSWHTGRQGRGVITNEETTLQQPKGLKVVIMEATSQEGISSLSCTDYQPK
ncbi:hypothetical protein [Streptomyces lutosisoli]|uniref:Adhesin n=1 Tax=Streptomyces lutosisoli TaxID=2665721 RepID=A0ABW2VI01_9ACTN